MAVADLTASEEACGPPPATVVVQEEHHIQEQQEHSDNMEDDDKEDDEAPPLVMDSSPPRDLKEDEEEQIKEEEDGCPPAASTSTKSSSASSSSSSLEVVVVKEEEEEHEESKEVILDEKQTLSPPIPEEGRQTKALPEEEKKEEEEVVKPLVIIPPEQPLKEAVVIQGPSIEKKADNDHFGIKAEEEEKVVQPVNEKELPPDNEGKEDVSPLQGASLEKPSDKQPPLEEVLPKDNKVSKEETRPKEEAAAQEDKGGKTDLLIKEENVEEKTHHLPPHVLGEPTVPSPPRAHQQQRPLLLQTEEPPKPTIDEALPKKPLEPLKKELIPIPPEVTHHHHPSEKPPIPFTSKKHRRKRSSETTSSAVTLATPPLATSIVAAAAASPAAVSTAPKAPLDIFDWPDEDEEMTASKTKAAQREVVVSSHPPPPPVSLQPPPSKALSLVIKEEMVKDIPQQTRVLSPALTITPTPEKKKMLVVEPSSSAPTPPPSSLIITPALKTMPINLVESKKQQQPGVHLKKEEPPSEAKALPPPPGVVVGGKQQILVVKDGTTSSVNLVDPETGYLHVMKPLEETGGKYIPVSARGIIPSSNSSMSSSRGPLVRGPLVVVSSSSVPTVLSQRGMPSKIMPSSSAAAAASIQIHPLPNSSSTQGTTLPQGTFMPPHAVLSSSSPPKAPTPAGSILLPNTPLPLSSCLPPEGGSKVNHPPPPRLPSSIFPKEEQQPPSSVQLISLKHREEAGSNPPASTPPVLDNKERIAIEALSSIPRYAASSPITPGPPKEEMDSLLLRAQQEANALNNELNLLYSHMMSKGHPEHVAMSLASSVLQDRIKSVRSQQEQQQAYAAPSYYNPSSAPAPVSTNPTQPLPEFTFPHLEDYPVVWQGFLGLKNDSATVQFHYVSGCKDLARASLPPPPFKDGELQMPLLRIGQRMRLEASQLEGVSRKMMVPGEHCILLALPCGKDASDVELQSRQLRNHLITYLQLKSAAGIVNVSTEGGDAHGAFVVHVFPSCDFANKTMGGIAPDLLARVAEIEHMVIIIATVFDNK
eukprot:TRINITY_DN1422_c0_g2_i3.p1 TRINITY_DN1422_c0_g2~~TRINITY_DN1422_c0_g2_i3.p1  ORF type:complete len:1044 (-),score=476.87 TRINITY_DN1422_c0_g2_i3:357-3488(-)